MQKLLRTFSLGAADVPALVLAEKRLLEMKDILRRQELEHACQMNPVMQLIRSALSCLENSPQPEDEPVGNTVPGQDVVITEDALASRLVYVIQNAPEVGIQVTEEQPKRWPAFVAGMAKVLVLSTATIFGWQVVHRPDKAALPMAASVACVPEAMTPTPGVTG